MFVITHGESLKLFPAMFPSIAGKLNYAYEVMWKNQKVPGKDNL